MNDRLQSAPKNALKLQNASYNLQASNVSSSTWELTNIEVLCPLHLSPYSHHRTFDHNFVLRIMGVKCSSHKCNIEHSDQWYLSDSISYLYNLGNSWNLNFYRDNLVCSNTWTFLRLSCVKEHCIGPASHQITKPIHLNLSRICKMIVNSPRITWNPWSARAMAVALPIPEDAYSFQQHTHHNAFWSSTGREWGSKEAFFSLITRQKPQSQEQKRKGKIKKSRRKDKKNHTPVTMLAGLRSEAAARDWGTE